MGQNHRTVDALAVELRQVTTGIGNQRRLPDAFRKLFGGAHEDAGVIARPGTPRFKLARGVSYLSALRSWRRKRKRAAEARIRRKAQKIEKLLRKIPKYKNKEFICITDYDRCLNHRGPNSTICAMAFIICMGRRAIPLLKQLGKAAKTAASGEALS